MKQYRTLSLQEVDHYHTNGYLLVPNVFSVKDINSLRETFLTAFKKRLWENAPNSNASIINDIYTYFPEAVQILYNQAFVNSIKDLAGNDAVWIPECSIHRNRYIGWHKDTSIQERDGESSHHQYDFPLIQAAIYFQDNDENGGGLTVIPKTHILPDPYSKMMTKNVLLRTFYKSMKFLRISPFDSAEKAAGKLHIPIKTGDLLLFDLRIDHRSTYPVKKKNTPAPDTDKLAIFNTFGGNNFVTKKYFDFMKQRPEPYYRYFSEKPLPEIVYLKGRELGINVWY